MVDSDPEFRFEDKDFYSIGRVEFSGKMRFEAYTVFQSSRFYRGRMNKFNNISSVH